MENFVTFELAVKLKEKGFKELCLAYYTNNDDLQFNYSHKSGAKYSDCYSSHNLMPKGSVSGKFVDAPTISQVLKWLREEKKMHIEPSILIDCDFDEDGKTTNEYIYWSFSIMSTETGYMIYFENERINDRRFDTYEEAVINGIEYVLNNILK